LQSPAHPQIRNSDALEAPRTWANRDIDTVRLHLDKPAANFVLRRTQNAERNLCGSQGTSQSRSPREQPVCASVFGVNHNCECLQTHLHTLQHTAAHCITLQYTAIHCNTPAHNYECHQTHLQGTSQSRSPRGVPLSDVGGCARKA